MAGFHPVDPKQSFPVLEEEVLARWKERDVFARQVSQREEQGAPMLELLRGPADGERPAGIAPRLRAGLQGRVPALPGDDGAHRPAQGRLGLSRPARRARDREGARDQLQARDRGVRNRRVQRALPRLRLPLRLRLGPDDRADRRVDRPRRPLRDDGRRLHRVVLVGDAPDVGCGPPVRGQQGRALLPALRDGTVISRGRFRIPRHHRHLRLRQAADHRNRSNRRDPRAAAPGR